MVQQLYFLEMPNIRRIQDGDQKQEDNGEENTMNDDKPIGLDESIEASLEEIRDR